ncbi:MAG: hypothetical protein AAGB97_06730 [Dehalococcoidia bacterium]
MQSHLVIGESRCRLSEEKTRQERREERQRKRRHRMRQHSKGLARIYRDAILKRMRRDH